MRHFSTEMAVYGPPIHCVNLAEKNGRERIITEAYLDQVTRLAFQIARKLSTQCWKSTLGQAAAAGVSYQFRDFDQNFR